MCFFLVAMYINHYVEGLYSSNCEFVYQGGRNKGVTVCSTEDIEAGMELFFDYGVKKNGKSSYFGPNNIALTKI